MADDPQTPGVDVGGADPLSVLEDLLKQAGSDGGAAGAPPVAGEAAVDGEKTPEEKAAAQAELEQKLAEQQQRDNEQLVAQREKMHELKNTPQYQARVQQDEEKAVEQSEHDAAGEGYEIRQLDHTKI